MTAVPARERVVPALAAGLGLLGLALVAILDPNTSRWLPPCPFFALTGWLCPGCGSARAVHALLHGDLVGALRLNPFTFVALGIVGADVALRLRRGFGIPFGRIPPRWLNGFAIALLVFAVCRNVWR
jgi:hypothetical protein